MSTRPSVLLVASRRWVQTAHLALAARRAGFDVCLLGPPGHPLAALGWVAGAGIFSPLRPAASVARVLNRGSQELVLPVDELAEAAVFTAYLDGRLVGQAAEVVERSLGDPATYALRTDRARFAEIVQCTGLSAAPTWRAPEDGDLDAALAGTGLPAVLKVDGSYGGQGVVVAHDAAGAHAAWAALRRRESVVTGLGRLVRDDDATYLRPALRRTRPVVSLQPFVEGEEATISVACWQGSVLGSLAFRAVQTAGTAGPATVVQPIDCPSMRAVAEAVVAALGLSGLCGIDFLLTADGLAVALELNARATPTAHLLVAGRQPLVELLAARLGVPDVGGPAPDGPLSPIALYPQERLRDPASPYVGAGYEDRPADALDVVELCDRSRPGPVSSLAARLRRRKDAAAWTSRWQPRPWPARSLPLPSP